LEFRFADFLALEFFSDVFVLVDDLDHFAEKSHGISEVEVDVDDNAHRGIQPVEKALSTLEAISVTGVAPEGRIRVNIDIVSIMGSLEALDHQASSILDVSSLPTKIERRDIFHLLYSLLGDDL